MKFEIAFLNGVWVPLAEAVLHPDDGGFIQGIVAVERLRTYSGILKHLPLYQSRLHATLHFLGLDAEKIGERFPSICTDLIKRNGIPQDGSTDVSLVFTVTPGRPGSGETVLAHLAPLPWQRIYRLLHDGQSLRTTPVQQIPIGCWPRHLKIRARLHYYLADREAQRLESDCEALLCDHDGTITETGTGNVLMVEGNHYCAPPPDRVLPGVTFHRLKQLLEQSQRPIHAEWITPERLLEADEVMMTGTTSGVWSVRQINGQRIGQPSNLTHASRMATSISHLQSLWYHEVGIDLAEQASRNLDRG